MQKFLFVFDKRSVARAMRISGAQHFDTTQQVGVGDLDSLVRVLLVVPVVCALNGPVALLPVGVQLQVRANSTTVFFQFMGPSKK